MSIRDTFRRLFGRAKEIDLARLQVIEYTPGEYFATSEAWIKVVSSNVHSFAFYGGGVPGTAGILRVRFLNRAKTGAGSEYQYVGVTVGMYESFLSAGSKGKWCWQHLRRAGLDYFPIWKRKY